MKITNYARLLLQTSAIVAVGVSSAYAQDAEPIEPEVLIAAADEAINDDEDNIVVTGSRIRSEFASQSPIEVLTIEEAQLEGIADVGTLLQTATIASGSPQVTAATSAQFVQNGGVGTTTVSLRGLGANRTLSLINGRRAGPSGTRGAVSSFDVNSIPLLALERVEILKDGASSIYGSDAVAGVVNYITDKSDSKTIDVFVTQPETSGGETYRASGSWGETFEKGRVRLTGDYTLQKELARGQRDFYDCAENYVFNADGSRADVIDPRTGEPQCIDLLWGHVWVYDYASTNVPTTFPFLAQFDYDGSLAANGLSPYPNQGGNGGFNISAPAGFFPIYYDQNDISGLADWNGITVGTEARGLVNGDHPFQDRQSLIPEIERVTFMADGEYELSDSIMAYGEALFNRRTTTQNSYRQFWTYVYGDQPVFDCTFGSSFYGGTCGNGGDPSATGWAGQGQWYSPTAITEFNDTKVEIDYLRFVGGLTGDFGSSFGERASTWNWDISAQYSKSSGDYTEDQIRNDSIQDNWFRVDNASCVGETSSVAGLPCVDLQWFDPQFLAGEIPADQAAFLFTTETGHTDYTNFSVEAYASGEIMDVPAGKMLGAFGVLFQRDEINDVPSQIIQDGNAWGASSAGITAGVSNTRAIYGELDIPIVKDVKFMESLEVKASARFTDVDTYGSGTTYKIGANWQVTPSIRLRATQGTSFRTPALFELFLEDQVSFQNVRGADPCVRWGQALSDGNISQNTANNCAADGIPDDFVGGAISTNIVTGGGLGVLDAETSDNFTTGVVWSPEFADLKVAFDYFRIEVNGQVAQLGFSNILNGCYSSENFANEPLCDLITRNPPGPDAFRVAELQDSFININSQFNEGLDLTLRYGQDTPLGQLTVDSQATYQLEDFTRLLAESAIQDTNGESGNPKLTANLRFTLENGPWTGVWNMDHIGNTNNRERYERLGGATTLFGVEVIRKLRTEAVTYHTASVRRQFGDSLAIVAGVRNIFDEHPPNVSTAAVSAGGAPRVGTTDFASQYDTIGRRFFVNVTKEF